MIQQSAPGGPALGADGNSSRSVPAPSRPRRVHGARLAGAWRTAGAAVRAGRNRLEATAAGRVWTRLCELGFMTSSLQFAAVFTLGFIPFLLVLSAALGPGLSRALVMASGLTPGPAATSACCSATAGRPRPACRCWPSCWRLPAAAPPRT